MLPRRLTIERDPVNSNPNQMRRVALMLGATAIWLLATAASVYSRWSLRVVIPTATVLLAFVTYVYLRIAFKTYTAAWTRPGVSPQFDTVRLVAAIDSLEPQISLDWAITFAGMLATPSRYFMRVAETVRTASRSMTVDGTYQLSLPPGPNGGTALIPLLRVRAHQSADSVTVTAASGEALPTLNYDQRLAAMGAIVRKFVSQASASITKMYIEKLEQSFVHILAAESPNPSLGLTELQAHLMDLDPALSKKNRQILQSAAWLMQLLVTQRPMIVVCPTFQTNGTPRQDLVLHVGSRLVPRYRLVARTRADLFRDRLRLFMGVRPTNLTVSLANASLTKAYHLEVIGPPGTYLARQHVETGDVSGATAPVALKARDRLGQRYGHIRIIGDNPSLARLGFYTAHFFERVPGSIATATLSALAAVTLIWVSCFSQLGISNGSASDLVAVLLAVPALMGTWTGFDRQTTLFGGTLVAKFSSLITVVLSLSAAAYFVLGPREASGLPMPKVLVDRAGAHVWLILGSLITLNLAGSAMSWALRSAAQAKFLDEGVQ